SPLLLSTLPTHPSPIRENFIVLVGLNQARFLVKGRCSRCKTAPASSSKRKGIAELTTIPLPSRISEIKGYFLSPLVSLDASLVVVSLALFDVFLVVFLVLALSLPSSDLAESLEDLLVSLAFSVVLSVAVLAFFSVLSIDESAAKLTPLKTKAVRATTKIR